jgi:hypothetical protein
VQRVADRMADRSPRVAASIRTLAASSRVDIEPSASKIFFLGTPCDTANVRATAAADRRSLS